MTFLLISTQIFSYKHVSSVWFISMYKSRSPSSFCVLSSVHDELFLPFIFTPSARCMLRFFFFFFFCNWTTTLNVKPRLPVITRHFISDSQLDSLLNRVLEIRLWVSVTQSCPSSNVFKLLSLLLNGSRLPIRPISARTGDVLHAALLDPDSLLVSFWGVSKTSVLPCCSIRHTTYWYCCYWGGLWELCRLRNKASL